MTIKEIKKLLKLSGGKLILANEEEDDSYVVMRLEDYLAEVGEDEKWESPQLDNIDIDLDREEMEPSFGQEIFAEESNTEQERAGLTKEELLDRINADIEELRERKNEEEVLDSLDDLKAEEDKVEYQEV